MKILVLLSNPFLVDSRVERLLDLLSKKKSNEILLLCTHKKGLPKKETHKNVTILREPYSRFFKSHPSSFFEYLFHRTQKKIKSLFTRKLNHSSKKNLPKNNFNKILPFLDFIKNKKEFQILELKVFKNDLHKIILHSLAILFAPLDFIATITNSLVSFISELIKPLKLEKLCDEVFNIFEFLLIPIVPISFLIQTILYNTNAILSHLFSILLLFFGFFAKTSDFLTFHKLSEMGSIKLNKNYTINDLISTNFFNINSSFYEFESYTALFKKNGIRFDPDFIHANDLSTLMAGYEIKKMTNAKLIYDSHELELDKNKFFPKLVKMKRRYTENKYIKVADFVITVSESIAEFLENTYKIDKPIVIYNSPKFLKPKNNEKDFNLHRYLKIPKGSKLIVYVGLISINRGIENAIESMKFFDKKTYLLLIGPINQTFNNMYLKRHLAFKKNTDKIVKNQNLILHAPVKHDLLNKILKQCDVSILPIQNVCKSYDYCFPNKLLESVFSNVPLSASSLTELSRFMKKYKAGEIFNEKNPRDIYLKTTKVLDNPKKYIVGKKQLKEIDEIYGFNTQQLKLKEIYK